MNELIPITTNEKQEPCVSIDGYQVSEDGEVINYDNKVVDLRKVK